MNKYWAIVPAAGVGHRMGADVPKQYLPLAGKSVFEHALNALLDCPRFEKIVVAVSLDDAYWSTLACSHHPKILVTPGGQKRCHSVLNGLNLLRDVAEPMDWVLVHDAARPCLCPEDIDHLMTQIADHPLGGLLGARVFDTIKQVNRLQEAEATLNRETLWRALTPQMFRFSLLHQALQTAVENKHWVTDEASAIELTGAKPLIVEGRADNIKITEPIDLALASFYLANRNR
jgi:2-C-methyl-D-erythritol 4-phosphate cytidylyltransferase